MVEKYSPTQTKKRKMEKYLIKQISSIEKNNKHNLEIFNESVKNDHIVNFIEGHKSHGKIRNPIVILKDGTYLMHCEPDIICILCEKSYKRILEFEDKIQKKLTFHGNKYPTGEIYIYSSTSKKSIHQIITGFYGHGRGTKNGSIDHIDRNPLNNRLDNLRIATHEEQLQNSSGIMPGTKRNRQRNAQELPSSITHDMLPKYVTYYNECYNTEKNLWREFFRIEGHPKLTKSCLSSSKSNKVSIHDKLEEIKEKLHRLDNNIEQEQRGLPTYHSIQNFRGAPNLIFDRRMGNRRYNLRMKMKETNTLSEELERFSVKFMKKYPNYRW